MISPVWQFVLVALTLVAGRRLHDLRGLRRIPLPYAMTAGVLLAVLLHVFPTLPKGGLKPLTGHLLDLFYITLPLKGRPPAQASRTLRTTLLFILWHYGMQAFIGLGTAMLLARLWYNDLPLVLGLFVPLGYALGPAQAYEIGKTWQDSAGTSLGDIGLTFGALGYIWASVGGALALYIFARQSAPHPKRLNPATAASKLNNHSNPLLFSLLHIFICYGLALGLLEAIGLALRGLIGLYALPLMDTLRSIRFVFCALAAMLFARCRHCSSKGARPIFAQPPPGYAQSLSQLADTLVQVMVCAGIGSVSFALVWAYIDVIVILALGSAAALSLLHFALARHCFHKDSGLYALVIYGGMMGTTSTGMALLAVLDPHFESPAAHDYLAATGSAFVGLLPVIISLQWIAAGQFYWALMLYAAYAVLATALLVKR